MAQALPAATGIKAVAGEKVGQSGTNPVLQHLAWGGAACFVGLVGALHLLRPEVDPSARYLSEYAVGRLGPLMMAAFGVMALSGLGLQWLLAQRLRPSRSRTAARVFLCIFATGMMIAGAFPTDLEGAPQTAVGTLHVVGAILLGFISAFIAALFTARALRLDGGFVRLRRLSLWLGGFAIIAFLAGPPVLEEALGQGGAQRVFVLGLALWLIVVGRGIARGRGSDA